MNDPASDRIVLVEAKWLAAPYPWFWECRACQCGFGPLVTRADAVSGAVEHLHDDHRVHAAEPLWVRNV
jgi:hypothetical protein